MDLLETTPLQETRHPWEKARVKFVEKVLSSFNAASGVVLDIGSGDGFVADQLLKRLRFSSYVGLDIHLSAAQIAAYGKRIPAASFYNDRQYIAGKRFDLLLLLDVLEHLEDDDMFLQETVAAHLMDKGKVLITVPAFPVLYGSHDTFLGHHRRYKRKKLQQTVQRAQLHPLATGYMFSSLLPSRAIAVLAEKIFAGKSHTYSGVGKWQYPVFFTRGVERILELDNNILYFAARHGLLIPGLSLWTMCEKQQ